MTQVHDIGHFSAVNQNYCNNWPITFELADVDSANVFVQFLDEEVNYLVDTASLTVVQTNPNWEEEANQRIEEIRKQDITVK